MTTSDTVAALASALPAIDYDNGYLDAHEVAGSQALALAEQGWVLVRPDDEDTVERVARAIDHVNVTAPGDAPYPHVIRLITRAALAALAARPGTADTEQAEVAE